MATVEELENEYKALMSKKIEELRKEEDTKAKQAEELKKKSDYDALVAKVKEDLGYGKDSKLPKDGKATTLAGNNKYEAFKQAFIAQRKEKDGITLTGRPYEEIIAKKVTGAYAGVD